MTQLPHPGVGTEQCRAGKVCPLGTPHDGHRADGAGVDARTSGEIVGHASKEITRQCQHLSGTAVREAYDSLRELDFRAMIRGANTTRATVPMTARTPAKMSTDHPAARPLRSRTMPIITRAASAA